MVVSEISISEGNSSSTTEASPARATVRNDGRSPRRRAYTVDVGIRNTASLPSSTSNVYNVIVEGIQRRFDGISSSIHDLTIYLTARAVHVVNDDLIKVIEELDRLENSNGNEK